MLIFNLEHQKISKISVICAPKFFSDSLPNEQSPGRRLLAKTPIQTKEPVGLGKETQQSAASSKKPMLIYHNISPTTFNVHLPFVAVSLFPADQAAPANMPNIVRAK
ncbi:MAG TPA: hypothetical protein ENK32_10820 [Anaerolineae bacterium]|nr:hypothetical protein [Anaerolineae bacterium]